MPAADYKEDTQSRIEMLYIEELNTARYNFLYLIGDNKNYPSQKNDNKKISQKNDNKKISTECTTIYFYGTELCPFIFFLIK